MVKTPRKRTAAKADAEEAAESAITNVTVGRSFTIPGEGEYESQKVSVLVSAPTYEEASAAVESFMVTEFEKSSEQFAQFKAASDALADEVSTDTSEEDDTEEDAEAEGEEEGDLTEDDIRAMDRSELVALIKSSELDIEYKSIKNTKKLAETVIEALTEEGGEEEDAEAEGEEAEEDGEEEGEEEADISEEDILAMDRKGLREFVAEHEIEVDADDFEKTKSGTKKFAAAVIEALSEAGDGEEEEADDDAEEEADDDGEEEADPDADNEGYTRKELEAMKPKDLQAIYKGWGIKDKFPTGSEPVIRKKAVNRILAYQENGE